MGVVSWTVLRWNDWQRQGLRLLCGVLFLGLAWGVAYGQTPPPASPPSAPPRSSSAPDLAAPLSIYESCLLLDQALAALKDPALPEADRAARADHIVRAVRLYVERVDRAHSTLPAYAWSQVGTAKVNSAAWSTLAFRATQPLKHVTALALRAHHGDIEIQSIIALDVNKTKWPFPQRLTVPADQPRPEICFLPLPTRLVEVQVVVRRVDPAAKRKPRLFVDAGVCAVAESAKQATHYLQVARTDLKVLKFQEASRHIRQARDLLREYQKSRRL